LDGGRTTPMKTTFTPTDAVLFILFSLLMGVLAGSFLISYLTEPDPFLSRGPQSQEVAKWLKERWLAGHVLHVSHSLIDI